MIGTIGLLNLVFNILQDFNALSVISKLRVCNSKILLCSKSLYKESVIVETEVALVFSYKKELAIVLRH